MNKMRNALAIVALFLLPLIPAEEMPSEEAPQPLEEIIGNVSTSIITVLENPGPLYSGFVDPAEKLTARIPTSASQISRVVCIPPERKSCDCGTTGRPGEFECSFHPPNVGGVYRINVESASLNAAGNFTMELKEDELPILRQVIRQDTIPSGLLILALSFAAVSVLAYLGYFTYRLMMRKRDALRSLYDERQKTEDDLKVLRFRFFKREIDASTYNTVFKQKETDLQAVNDRILQMLKKKPKQEQPTQAPETT